MQSWAVRCAIQDQTFMLENMNDAFGSVPAVEPGLTAARHDAAVHDAEMGHDETFGPLG